jgi:pilus assembly protein CpaE
MVGGDGLTNLVTVTDKNADETTSEFLGERLTMLPLWRFYLLAGSPDPETSSHLKVGRIWDIVNTLKATYDYVIIDLGRSLSKFGLSLIQLADLVALTISADLSTITLTKILLEYLKSKGLNDASFFTILNRAVGLEGLSKPEIEKILGVEIKAAMPYLGSNFALANNQRQPFSLKFPKDTAAIVLSDAAQRMIYEAQRLRAES